MAKVKKTFRIEEDIYDELVELSTEWSVSQGAAVERAIRLARQIASAAAGKLPAAANSLGLSFCLFTLWP